MGKVDILQILNDCNFPGWEFYLGRDGERLYLQIKCDGICNATGEKFEWTGRKWFISPHMTKSEIVQTAFKAVMTAMEHEVREQFTYKEKNIFGPHFDVDILVELCQNPDNMDVRD